ncbi:MAG TPA: DMT family transporter [Chloroflexota bacterium]|nr:DMT family transporter [Chloroflexota bacterium]
MFGELSALISAFTWALTSVLLRQLQFRTNALSLNALRNLIAAITALAAVAITGKMDCMDDFSPTSLAYLATSVLVGVGIGDTVYFRSLKLVGTAKALLLSNAYPLFTAMIAIVFLHEPLTLGLLLGTGLVIAGVIMVLIPGRALVDYKGSTGAKGERLGVLLALLAALCWATAISMVKVGAQEVDGLSATTVRLMVAAFALLTVGAVSPTGLQLGQYRGKHLAGTVAAGVITTICSGTFLLAVQFTGAAKAATLTSTAPLFGVPMSLLTGEKLTWQIVLGSIISVAGIWMVVAG